MTTAYSVIPDICDDCEEDKPTRAYDSEGHIWFCCEICFLINIEEDKLLYAALEVKECKCTPIEKCDLHQFD